MRRKGRKYASNYTYITHFFPYFSFGFIGEAAKHYVDDVDKFAKSTMDGLEEAADVLFAAQKRVLDQFDDIRRSSTVIYLKDK